MANDHETPTSEQETAKTESRLRKMGRTTLEVIGSTVGVAGGGGIFVSGMITAGEAAGSGSIPQIVAGGVAAVAGVLTMDKSVDVLTKNHSYDISGQRLAASLRSEETLDTPKKA